VQLAALAAEEGRGQPRLIAVTEDGVRYWAVFNFERAILRLSPGSLSPSRGRGIEALVDKSAWPSSWLR
jgi:hypothetical protein